MLSMQVPTVPTAPYGSPAKVGMPTQDLFNILVEKVPFGTTAKQVKRHFEGLVPCTVENIKLKQEICDTSCDDFHKDSQNNIDKDDNDKYENEYKKNKNNNDLPPMTVKVTIRLMNPTDAKTLLGSIQNIGGVDVSVRVDEEEENSRKVCILNMNPRATQGDVLFALSQIGKVTVLQMPRQDPEKVKYAFATFETEEQAAKATQLKSIHVCGTSAVVRGYDKSSAAQSKQNQTTDLSDEANKSKLFVGNLPNTWDSDFLKQAFENEFQGVVSACIPKSSYAVSGRAYGFVTFESPEVATAVLQQFVCGKHLVNGVLLTAQRVQPKYNRPQPQVYAHPQPPSHQPYNNNTAAYNMYYQQQYQQYLLWNQYSQMMACQPQLDQLPHSHSHAHAAGVYPYSNIHAHTNTNVYTNTYTPAQTHTQNISLPMPGNKSGICNNVSGDDNTCEDNDNNVNETHIDDNDNVSSKDVVDDKDYNYSQDDICDDWTYEGVSNVCSKRKE